DVACGSAESPLAAPAIPIRVEPCAKPKAFVEANDFEKSQCECAPVDCQVMSCLDTSLPTAAMPAFRRGFVYAELRHLDIIAKPLELTAVRDTHFRGRTESLLAAKTTGFALLAVLANGILQQAAKQMSRDDDNDRPRRKRRTREHVIEDLSENHLERRVLLKGHLLRRPERDYAVDITMFHFANDGEIENGEVRFQLKATDNLKTIKQGTMISFPIKTGDLHYWALEIFPFILVVFDAKVDRAYWLAVREYVSLHPDIVDPDRDTVNVHIPVSNELTVESVECFRIESLQIVKKLRDQGGFPDVTRRPR
ncbi:DUF4365 domain-containing protein, partial [Planctomycetota bacterium]